MDPKDQTSVKFESRAIFFQIVDHFIQASMC